MADAPIFVPISISGRIRQWLLDNPGWHFASDVHEAMRARTPKARQTVSALLANQAHLGVIDRKGQRGLYRYAANSNTGHVNGHSKLLRRQSPLEEAFEAAALRLDQLVDASARAFIDVVRQRAAAIAARRLEDFTEAEDPTRLEAIP